MLKYLGTQSAKRISLCFLGLNFFVILDAQHALANQWPAPVVSYHFSSWSGDAKCDHQLSRCLSYQSQVLSVPLLVQRIREADRILKDYWNTVKPPEAYSPQANITDIESQLDVYIDQLFALPTNEARGALAQFLLLPDQSPFAYQSVVYYVSRQNEKNVQIPSDEKSKSKGAKLVLMTSPELIDRFFAVATIAQASAPGHPTLAEILKPLMTRSALPLSYIQRSDRGLGEGGRHRELLLLAAERGTNQIQDFVKALGPQQAAAVALSVLDNNEVLYPSCNPNYIYVDSNKIVAFSNLVLNNVAPQIMPSLTAAARKLPAQTEESFAIEMIMRGFSEARTDRRLDGNTKGACGCCGSAGQAFRAFFAILDAAKRNQGI